MLITISDLVRRYRSPHPDSRPILPIRPRDPPRPADQTDCGLCNKFVIWFGSYGTNFPQKVNCRAKEWRTKFGPRIVSTAPGKKYTI
jgi:hypothetical protein